MLRKQRSKEQPKRSARGIVMQQQQPCVAPHRRLKHPNYETGQVPIHSRYIPPGSELEATLHCHCTYSSFMVSLAPFPCLTDLMSPKINMTVPRRFAITVPWILHCATLYLRKTIFFVCHYSDSRVQIQLLYNKNDKSCFYKNALFPHLRHPHLFKSECTMIHVVRLAPREQWPHPAKVRRRPGHSESDLRQTKQLCFLNFPVIHFMAPTSNHLAIT